MHDEKPHPRADGRDQGRPPGDQPPTSSSIVPAMAISRPGPARAIEVGDNARHMLYPSMMFRLNGIDPEKAGDAWRTIPALMEKAEASGTHHFPRKAAIVRPQRSPIEWRVNFTQLAREDGAAINGLEPDDLTRGEIEGRRQAVDVVRIPAHRAGVREILHRRPAAAARHPRNPAHRRRLYALGRGRARLRLVRRLHRRQRLADGIPCRGRRDLQIPADPGVARLQRIAVSHAGSRKASTICWWPGAAPR